MCLHLSWCVICAALCFLPVLSCAVLSCPVLPCAVLCCLVLSCAVLCCPVLSCAVLCCPVVIWSPVKISQHLLGNVLKKFRSNFKFFLGFGHSGAYFCIPLDLCCPALSCAVLCCPVLSCPVLSCPVLSCAVLSSPVLSCAVLCRIHCFHFGALPLFALIWGSAALRLTFVLFCSSFPWARSLLVRLPLSQPKPPRAILHSADLPAP